MPPALRLDFDLCSTSGVCDEDRGAGQGEGGLERLVKKENWMGGGGGGGGG